MPSASTSAAAAAGDAPSQRHVSAITPSRRSIELPKQRSRGQIARRQSITRGTERLGRGSLRRGATGAARPHAGQQADTVSSEQESDMMSDASLEPAFGIAPASPSNAQRFRSRSGHTGKEKVAERGHSSMRHKDTRRTHKRPVLQSTEQPWLGGLYFTDVVFIAFTYAINLLRTCGLAELADVAFKGLVYALSSLPIDLYRRWTLSTPPDASDRKKRHAAARIRRRRARDKKRSREDIDAHVSKGVLSDSSESESDALGTQPGAFAASGSRPTGDVVEQLSPFHHLVILLSRFACGHFPHLLPRILFAEETIGPFVYWRTGGGSNVMVQEFTDLSERSTPVIQDNLRGPVRPPQPNTVEPGFRAYLLSKDVHVPTEVQRANFKSRRATTVLYLHGGGFSLGSVAFYAEALLRVRAKVALLEAEAAHAQGRAQAVDIAEARCVAVEYDLSPAARFPIPLLQCLRCYAYLVEVEKIDPNSICVAGDSAGGNLAMSMLLCLSGQMRNDTAVREIHERDWSVLPMPGKAVLISPWVDLRPSTAHAFASLRGYKGRDTERQHRVTALAEQTGMEFPHDDKASKAAASTSWTNAVAQYDWDFVASESLLHFAQVYAGVLPLPRRVFGPLGWIAHICGVLALGESPSPSEAEGDSVAHDIQSPWPYQLKGFMDPSRAFSAFSRPTRKIASATQGFLTDPLLSRFLGSSSKDERSVVGENSSSLYGLEPLFRAEDRRTQLVGDKSQLYEPIDAPFAATQAEKIGADGSPLSIRQRGLHLLETHPLLNPALGDWSRISLKHGCLVTWGERERMAADIEAWVDSIPGATGSLSHTDIPVQDDLPTKDTLNTKPSLKKEPIKNREKAEADPDWVFVAVEKGPGGVHAWPFVSMYLAGSEQERERGLDLLAHFIAQLPKTNSELNKKRMQNMAKSPTAFDTQIGGDVALSSPESPDNDDAASVGSMPSDVDLHGMIDDDEDEGEEDIGEELPDNFWAAMSSPSINVADAVQRAQELGYGVSDSSASPSSERHYHPVTPPRSTSFQKDVTRKTTPVSAGKRPKGQSSAQTYQNVYGSEKHGYPHRASAASSSSEDNQTPRQAATVRETPRTVRPWPSPPVKGTSTPKERGRSRSPRRGNALSSPSASRQTSKEANVLSLDLSRPGLSRSASGSSSSSTSVTSALGTMPVISPDEWSKNSSSQDGKAIKDAKEEQATEMKMSNAASQRPIEEAAIQSPASDRPMAILAEDDDDVPIPRVPRYGLDDIAEASSEEAISPVPRRASLPKTTEHLSTDAEGGVFDTSVATSPKTGSRRRAEELIDGPSNDSMNEPEDSDSSLSFGLSHYAIRRPEPEGLSDITEESSVLSASYTSGMDVRSRSVSPVGYNLDTSRSGHGTASLLGAATQVMQGEASGMDTMASNKSYAQAAGKLVPQSAKQWRFLRDEIPMSRRKSDKASPEALNGPDEQSWDDDADVEDDIEEGSDSAYSSPPGRSQPGPSLRTISSSSSLRSQHKDKQLSTSSHGDDSTPDVTDADTPTRKKPKGDVWW